MKDSSANPSQKSAEKSALPILGLVVLWSAAIFCSAYFGRGLAGKVLPKFEEIVWSTQFPISTKTTVTIRAWRHGEGDFSQKRPINDCDIALNGSHVMDMGPNVSICHYIDQHGETIRGATPPDAPFIADWLKDAGEPPAAAPQIAAKVAPLFDFDKLNSGLGPEWSTVHTETVPQLSYVFAVIVLVLLWLAGTCAIVFIASARRKRRMDSNL